MKRESNKAFIITLISIFSVTAIICVAITNYLPKLIGISAEQVNNSLVDDSLFTVDVTIPADFFINAKPTATLTEQQKSEGYKSAVVNSDGSLTYTIKKSSWNNMVSKYREEVKTELNSIITKGSYPSLKQIQYNNDFSKVTLTVNKSQYEENLDSLATMGIYMNIMFFQTFSQTKLGCVITIKDASTGAIIGTEVYPKES